MVALAKKLARYTLNGRKRSLREVAAELETAGHTAKGKRYSCHRGVAHGGSLTRPGGHGERVGGPGYRTRGEPQNAPTAAPATGVTTSCAASRWHSLSRRPLTDRGSAELHHIAGRLLAHAELGLDPRQKRTMGQSFLLPDQRLTDGDYLRRAHRPLSRPRKTTTPEPGRL
jgi:hypothetical protein